MSTAAIFGSRFSTLVAAPAAFGNALASGNNVVYTAPATRRTAVKLVNGSNPTGGAISVFAGIKVGATTYQITPTSAIAAGGWWSASPVIVLEPGESLVVNTTALGFNAWFDAIEFDNAIPLYTAKLLAPVSGNNLLYTAPSTRPVLVCDNTLIAAGFWGLLNYQNNTVASQTVGLFQVPSAQSVGSTYQVASAVVVTGAGLQQPWAGTLAPGDKVYVNLSSSTAGQIPWINVAEIIPEA